MIYTDANVAIPLDEPEARTMAGYLVRPEGAGPFPGVVVIHEIFGLNENIRDIARRFAAEGYVALAVDLFSTGPRIICLFQAFYGMMFRSVTTDTVKHLSSALDFLQAEPGVDPKRVGAIGFCMGGGYALQLACVDGDLRGASVFYGRNPKPLQAVARACPIVGSYPENDFTASAGRELDEVLDKYQIDHDIWIYPGAAHSFFNDTGPSFNAQASADAWKRTLSFFEKHLRGDDRP